MGLSLAFASQVSASQVFAHSGGAASGKLFFEPRKRAVYPPSPQFCSGKGPSYSCVLPDVFYTYTTAMVNCLDVCGSIYGLVKAINAQVERMDMLREEARKLYRYIKRVEVLVSDLQPYIGTSEDPALVSSLQGIDGVLKTIWRLLEECCVKGRVASYLQADRTLDKFHVATGKLELSVQALSSAVAGMAVVEETAEELLAVRAMLQRAKYDLPADHQRLLTQFRDACDQLKDPFEAMKEACNAIIKTVCDEPQLSKDVFFTVINDLQKEVHYVHSTGAAEDEFYIKMLMDMVRVTHTFTEAPLDYICPITHQIMHDPVILHETGHSYERNSIQDWFNKGHHFCPRSGIQLKRLNITSNHNLKDAIGRWSLHNDMQLQFRPVLSTLSAMDQCMHSHPDPSVHGNAPHTSGSSVNGYAAATVPVVPAAVPVPVVPAAALVHSEQALPSAEPPASSDAAEPPIIHAQPQVTLAYERTPVAQSEASEEPEYAGDVPSINKGSGVESPAEDVESGSEHNTDPTEQSSAGVYLDHDAVVEKAPLEDGVRVRLTSLVDDSDAVSLESLIQKRVALTIDSYSRFEAEATEEDD